LDFRQERLKLLQAGPSVLGRDVVGNGDFQKLACFVNFGYKHVIFRSEENDINGRVRVHYSSRDAALPRGIVVPHQLIIEACTLRWRRRNFAVVPFPRSPGADADRRSSVYVASMNGSAWQNGSLFRRRQPEKSLLT
jgi:hypothetical protein